VYKVSGSKTPLVIPPPAAIFTVKDLAIPRSPAKIGLFEEVALELLLSRPENATKASQIREPTMAFVVESRVDKDQNGDNSNFQTI
jgi:hypothetical protein